MKKLCTDLLRGAVEKVITSNGDERLPLNIVILRLSGSDGLLKTVISKEIAGFKQALYEFGKQQKDMLKKAGVSRWHPGCIFSVLQDNVADVFGVGNESRIQYSKDAIAITDKITSSKYFDVFLSIPAKQERMEYSKTIRMVTLVDDYNTGQKKTTTDPKDQLRKREDLFYGLYQFVYSSF
eukprot:TRINITY_DN10553_c0_g1_i1.p1 TRINITY_DN10553_c0_g1~~TRINITY_DN10553_c0_g1_i1.p1  ORF type:complete len:181 (-),score=52.99 TRINITY_DN10553_c0_g1_i1:283-825(-)